MTVDHKMNKYCFGDIYNQECSKPYASALRKLEYRNPDYLSLYIHHISDFQEKSGLSRVRMLDVCCGYGVNSAVLRYGRYDGDILDAVETRFPYNKSDNFEIIGLDIADNALKFAMECGALDYAVSVNIEVDEINEQNAKIISGTDIIISTGSLSYITDKTLGKILKIIDSNRPLLIMFWPIVGHDYKNIVDCLKKYGFDIIEDNRLHWHRKFADMQEKESFLSKFDCSNRKDGIYVSTLIALR